MTKKKRVTIIMFKTKLGPMFFPKCEGRCAREDGKGSLIEVAVYQRIIVISSKTRTLKVSVSLNNYKAYH